MKLKKMNLAVWIISVTVFISVITQIFVDISILKLLMNLLWIVILANPIFNNELRIKTNSFTRKRLYYSM